MAAYIAKRLLLMLPTLLGVLLLTFVVLQFVPGGPVEQYIAEARAGAGAAVEGGGALSYESPRKTYLNHRNNLLMIYKNKQHPGGVLFVRGLLDYAAACFYLLQGRWGAFKAVFQARRDYRAMRRNYR